MAVNKNIQMKFNNGVDFDSLFPKTKAELVDGLPDLLDVKVDKVVGKGLSTEDYTSAEKSKLTGISDNANNYVHPTTAGNKHIPTGGASGNLLKYSASGTAAWSNLSVSDIPTLSLAKISDSGTAAGLNIGTSSGNIPVLDGGGKIDPIVLPALAITDTFVISSQTAMLALTAQVGDVAVRTDQSRTYILQTSPASTLANWKELLNPESPVQSVAGKTGTVTLAKGDVGLGSVDNTSDANKPVSTAQQTAINAKPSLGTTSTTAYRGDYGATAYTHSQAAHAPANAQKNSDITKSEIELKLTGKINTHSHIAVQASEPTGVEFWYQEI